MLLLDIALTDPVEYSRRLDVLWGPNDGQRWRLPAGQTRLKSHKTRASYHLVHLQYYNAAGILVQKPVLCFEPVVTAWYKTHPDVDED